MSLLQTHDAVKLGSMRQAPMPNAMGQGAMMPGAMPGPMPGMMGGMPMQPPMMGGGMQWPMPGAMPPMQGPMQGMMGGMPPPMQQPMNGGEVLPPMPPFMHQGSMPRAMPNEPTSFMGGLAQPAELSSKPAAAFSPGFYKGTPTRPGTGIIEGVIGTAIPRVNSFPAEMPFPGPIIAPPPLSPGKPPKDPNDKVELASQDKSWALNHYTSANMMAAQAHQAVALAKRDGAWAHQESSHAKHDLKVLKASGKATKEQIAAANQAIKLAQKDVDWAGAETQACLIALGQALAELGIASRDKTFASAEKAVAEKARDLKEAAHPSLLATHSKEARLKGAKKEVDEAQQMMELNLEGLEDQI